MKPAPDKTAPLDEWLGYLEHLHSREIDLGLERVLIVYRRLVGARPRGRVVTVGGTNGKGSTVHALEQLLLGAGCSTGAYTSPHILRFNERIRVNGEEVDDGVITAAFSEVEKARQDVPLTYFEFTTLAGLCIFQHRDPDFLLLEVGLGGRLDAVNCVDPDLAIITSVDLDHTQWLGEDRDRIGYEKAGIFRPDIPAIFGDRDPPDSVMQQARAQNIELRVLGRDFGLQPAAEAGGSPTLVLDGPAGGWELAAPPGLSEDRLVALQALLDLGFRIDTTMVERAATLAAPAGRFQRYPGTPEVILDVGHNPHAARWLGERLDEAGSGRRILAVYAALRDKDVSGVVDALRDRVDGWFLAGLNEPRGHDGETLRQTVGEGLEGAVVSTHETIALALEAALDQAAAEDLVVVFGSFYAVGQAREFLARR